MAWNGFGTLLIPPYEFAPLEPPGAFTACGSGGTEAPEFTDCGTFGGYIFCTPGILPTAA